MIHTFEKIGDKIVETTVSTIEYNAADYILRLENEIIDIVQGRDNYLYEINQRISSIQSKIDECNKLK